MFVGRGATYPVALEGALKLKEVSYVHAEGYAAGELKHGPISLLDAECPLVAVATRSAVYDKLISNVMEGRARDARVIAVATEGDEAIEHYADDICWVPDTHEASAPCWRSSRSSCSRITSPSRGARTSTSRATWPSRSRWSRARREPFERSCRGPRPGRDDRARHRHHQGRPDPGRARAVRGALLQARADRSGAALRPRPAETMAGRWAAKEAVSKVLGLGVRGIGWRDIEIERMPTGQPAVRLHGRAAARAEQLGMERIAVSITHESDYAVAIAFGVRTAGGRYVFPPDIEDRLDERERRILARIERLRSRGRGRRRRSLASDAPRRPSRSDPVPERQPVGFGRRDAPPDVAGPAGRAVPGRRTKLDDDIAAGLIPERPARGHKGSFGKLLVIAGSLDYAGAALLVCRAAGRAGVGPGHAGRARVAPAAVRREGRRGDDDGPARGRRRGDRPGARRWRGSSTTSTTRSWSGRGCDRPGHRRARRGCSSG